MEGLALLRAWAGDYDEAFVTARLAEVRRLLDEPALARHAGVSVRRGDLASAYRAWRGHRLLGVDGSAEMLDRARVRVPTANFARADLHRLPLADDAVDVVVCGLALAHLPALAPVLAEFARVLRPGGHLVISDAHHELVLRGSVVHAPGPAGEPGLAP